jgi:hypothetical protein
VEKFNIVSDVSLSKLCSTAQRGPFYRIAKGSKPTKEKDEDWKHTEASRLSLLVLQLLQLAMGPCRRRTGAIVHHSQDENSSSISNTVDGSIAAPSIPL